MNLPQWNLSDFYKGTDDPKITTDKKWLVTEAKVLTKKYKGKINSSNLTAKLLLQAIKDMEVFDEKIDIYLTYAGLLHEKDGENEKINKFFQEASEFGNKISSELIWFSLEWQKLVEAKAKKLISNPTLSNYKHFLTHSRLFSKFKLSESEEIILNKKDQTSWDAMTKFYDEINGAQRYSLTGNKKYQSLNFSEISKILSYDKDRNLRQKAAEAITHSLEKSKYYYTFSLNNLLLDKKINDELRGYKYPQQKTFLGYEVDPRIVESLVNTVIKNYSICSRYYKAKSKILKIDKLNEWDRYSPIFSEKKQSATWSEAKNIVLENFEQFSPVFSEIAKKFFDNSWIDAEVTKVKSSGAFCSYATPSLHPVILVNFTGESRDVSTLAHELGHGIHAYLSRQNTLFNFWPSTATAEIASVFCESVVFEAILENTTDPKVKLNLLASKIEESFATIFRQTAFYLFESDLHQHRRDKGQLTTEEISKYFQNRLQSMFGQSLKLTEGHRLWWMNVGHFYHYNFYVFTYAFGEALTKSLFSLYKKQGQKFIDKYINALKLGGSLTPSQITKSMGVDINQPDFWNNGIRLLEDQIDEFIKLSAQI